MKISIRFSFLFFFFTLLFSVAIQAQPNNDAKLLGKWSFDRYEFLNPSADTIAMKKESKGLILSFEKGQKFVTKKKKGAVETLVGTGTYSISEDGKYLYQNDEEVEIIELDDKVLVIKVPDAVIMHLKRVK